MITHTRRITVEISDEALALIAAGGKEMALALGLDERMMPLLQLTSKPNPQLLAALLGQQLGAVHVPQTRAIREYR